MAPWKCPDCGVWWAGLEHRCSPIGTGTGAQPSSVPWIVPATIPFESGGTMTTRCTCPANRGDNYNGFCLIHDVQVMS